jgi:excisionase family DNA binding protein
MSGDEKGKPSWVKKIYWSQWAVSETLRWPRRRSVASWRRWTIRARPRLCWSRRGTIRKVPPTIELPPQAMRAIADLLGLMGQQQPILLLPQKHELTTQEAAGILNVSRPFVVKQIETGMLQCRKVGRHRRIEFQELMRFQRQLKQQSEEALQGLADLSQELGLEY